MMVVDVSGVKIAAVIQIIEEPAIANVNNTVWIATSKTASHQWSAYCLAAAINCSVLIEPVSSRLIPRPTRMMRMINL